MHTIKSVLPGHTFLSFRSIHTNSRTYVQTPEHMYKLRNIQTYVQTPEQSGVSCGWGTHIHMERIGSFEISQKWHALAISQHYYPNTITIRSYLIRTQNWLLGV